MKWIYAVATFAIFAVSTTCAYDLDGEEEEGDARLGFISVGTGGTTSLTFNATSIQNAVILGLFLLVLGALLIPLFGAPTTEDEGYGYGNDQSGYSTGYEDPAAGYQGYAKRSLLQNLSPVMAALSSGQKKYGEEEQ